MTDPILDLMRPQTTGGKIVTFKHGVSLPDGRESMRNAAGSETRMFSALDESLGGFDTQSGVVLIEDLGIAYIPPDGDGDGGVQAVSTRLLADDRIEMVRPEFYLYALQTFADSADATWGLDATGALASPFTGAGVKLAVLDTGLDFGHPDFMGRTVVSESFVAGETVDDVQGHGTHCAGTAAGGRANGGSGLRYGVASGCDLYVGKVLNNAGFGTEREVQAAIRWAIRSGCAVISMSLGRAVRPGEPYEPDYERLGDFAFANGSLIVAAAGNDSGRTFGNIAPVSSPANAPTIMAVAALDQALAIAEFSNGAMNGAGGAVDIAGPGVGVLSSTPRPQLYATFRGTSMACPHVAGVAALWAESDPNLRGRALWDQLLLSARGVAPPRRDVGAGLVQAPGGSAGLIA